MNSGSGQREASLRVLQLNSMLMGGGTDDQCLKLACGLQQLGHPVWLAGPDGRSVSRVARELRLPFVPNPPEGPLKLRFIAAATKIIRQQQIQIVHAHHGRDYWPVVLAARLSGRHPKIVLTRHLAKSPSSWFSRRYLLRQCDAVIAVSRFVAKVLREGQFEPDSPEPERRARPPLRGDHSKIHVIYGGIDVEQFRPFDASRLRKQWGLEPEHYAFAVVGGFNAPRGKGQREFLAAAAHIREEAPRARFLIIGRGDLENQLRHDIERLELTGKARLVGYCEEMQQAMNAIDCLVHPQIGTESFGLVLLEAFACGKPVIASNLDGIPEAFAMGEHGQLVAPEDIQALSRAMINQIQQPHPSPEQRAQLHTRVAEKTSIQIMTTNVLALYRSMKPLC